MTLSIFVSSDLTPSLEKKTRFNRFHDLALFRFNHSLIPV